MNEEQINLVFKDLCNRLPYFPNVYIRFDYDVDHAFDSEYNIIEANAYVLEVNIDEQTLHLILNTDNKDLNDYFQWEFDEEWKHISEVKPYLRSLSSITKEEELELVDLGLAFWDYGKFKNSDGETIIYGEKTIQFIPDIETYDWLNKHHFDYRRLIENGLAIEAPENMYKI